MYHAFQYKPAPAREHVAYQVICVMRRTGARAQAPKKASKEEIDMLAKLQALVADANSVRGRDAKDELVE